jgi:hypothetical protein
MSVAAPPSLPITPDDVIRELAHEDDRVVIQAASALGALAVRVPLPPSFAPVVDVLVREVLQKLTTNKRAQAAALAGLAGLIATVDGARAAALSANVIHATMTHALDHGRAVDVDDSEDDGATASCCVNALDCFRFLQNGEDDGGLKATLGDSACVEFVLACAKRDGSSELDAMKRVGGVDLVVNIAQQLTEDEAGFDDFMRRGAFECFTSALRRDDDDVAVRGCIGLACALPRRRALRTQLASDGNAVRRLASLMGSGDEDVKGFASGLFRALAMDPETKPFVEKALRDGAGGGAVDSA